VPASLLEVVLAAEGEGCVRFYEEERPAERTVCARREGEVVAAEVGGVRVRVAPGEGGFPREVEVAGRFRFVRDPAALLPARPPQIAGTSVPGPADPRAARTFCGIGADRAHSPAPPPELPPPRAPGASCRDKTRAWLAAARARGFEGRAAVGIAWDGGSFVWHEWAEVRAGGAWLAVDPSFRELPARGPRFTIARFREDDPIEREAAGGRIITCWGNAVE
jgi:hypothetical protein